MEITWLETRAKKKLGGLQPERPSLRPVSMTASRESTPMTRSRRARPPKYHRPQGGYHINSRWSDLIRLVAQDVLNIRNRPGRLHRRSRKDSDTLLRRIEHLLYAWQDASCVRCDERIVRVQHSGSTLQPPHRRLERFVDRRTLTNRPSELKRIRASIIDHPARNKKYLLYARASG
jgi:hypothetical protein